MSYSNNIYKKSNEILKNIKEKNEIILEKRKEEILNKIPKYSDLKNDALNYVTDFINNMKDYSSKDLSNIKTKIKNNELKRKALLKENGYDENYLEPIYNCNKCKDTGYMGNKKCECFIKIIKDISKQESNLTYILNEQNFNNFDLNVFSDKIGDSGISPKENMKNILTYVKKFIDEFDDTNTKSMLFTGNTGVGKTYLSSCIADALLEDNKNVLYQTSSKICEILEEYKFNRENTQYNIQDIIKDLYNIDLLIIDDFGAEFKTAYTLTSLFELINSRLINNKKMIISTNLSILELKEIYSERLFSRFIGDFLILEFIGEDLRTKRVLKK